MRRFGILPMLALGALVATPFAAPPARVGAAGQPHVLRFATAEEVSTLNPVLNAQTVVWYLSQMTAAYCFRTDRDNRLVPELALEVPTRQNGGISPDGKTITLHFRHGVKWSDGAPFDADDFKFTVAAIDNPANIVPTREGFDQVASVDEPDKFTAVVHLKKPYGAIVPTLFASLNVNDAILPKHILGALPDMNNAPYNALPVGIGPFRYLAWHRGDAIELEPNPYYWRGRPALQRVVMKLIPDRNTVLAQLETGELDLWYPFGGAFLARVQAIPDVRVLRRPAYSINEFIFNLRGPVLSDRSVRLALRLGTNRRSLRDKLGHGVGILQDVLLPTVDPSTPKDIAFVEYDPAKANAMLDAAGWKRGGDGIRAKNGTRLALDVASSAGTPDVDSIVEFLRDNWKDLGVELSVQRYQSSMLFAPFDQGGIFYNGKFDVILLGRTTTPPFGVANLFACDQFPPAGQNAGHYCNPALDAVVAKYDRSYDFDERAKLLSRAMHLLDDDLPALAYIGREDLFGVKKSVTGFDPHPAAPFDDMLRVDVP